MAKPFIIKITLPDDFESMYMEKYAELFCMLPQPSEDEISEALGDWIGSVWLVETVNIEGVIC